MIGICFIAFASATLGQASSVSHLETLSEALEHPGRLAPAPGGGVYVTDQPSNNVVEYPAGGGAPNVYSVLGGPVGIAYRPQVGGDGGRVLVSLANGRIGVYTTALVPVGGSLVADVLDEPNDMTMYAVTTDVYRVFVVDSGASQVVVLQEGPLDTWTEVNRFGMTGSGLGEAIHPQAIAIDPGSGMVVVTDVDNFRAQVFDTNGYVQSRFGHRVFYGGWGTNEFAWFARCEGIAFDACGNIYISDALMGTVRVFDALGAELPAPYSPVITYGTGLGQVRIPIDVMIEGGKLFVASSYNSAVEVYDVACTMAATGLDKSARIESIVVNNAGGFLRGGEVKAVRRPAGPDNPFDIVAVIDSGEYARSSDLNLDRRVDLADLEIAIDGFGMGSIVDFVGASRAVKLTSFDPPHVLYTPDACGRCHAMSGLPGGMLSTAGQENLCLSCHVGGGVALRMPISGIGKGKAHPRGIPADSGGVRGPDPDGLLAQHLDQGKIKCTTCHDQHNELFRPYLRASGTNGALCGGCHQEYDEWLHAGHGDREGEAFVRYDWTQPDRQSCRKCHSGNGFIGFSEGLAPSRQSGEFRVHDCQVCHDVHGNGNEHFLRVFGEVTLPGGQVVEAGEDAGCLECHNGQYAPNTGNDAPHNMLGGVMMEGINAIEFSNTTLANSAHSSLLGCVDCHMADGPAEGDPGAGKVGGHSFAMSVSDPSDSDFGFENVKNACSGCHGNLVVFNRKARGDFDGDGTIEGVQDEVGGLLGQLYDTVVAAGAVDLGGDPRWSFDGVVDGNSSARCSETGG